MPPFTKDQDALRRFPLSYLWGGQAAGLKKFSSELKDALRRLLSPQTIFILISVSSIAAIIGPFGTYGDYRTLVAIRLWLAINGAASVAIYFCYALISSVVDPKRKSVFAISLLVTGSVLGSASVEMVLVQYAQGLDEAKPTFGELILLFGFILTAIMILRDEFPWASIYGRRAAEAMQSEARQEDTGETRSVLAERLDLPMGVQILRVSAQGHFVDVYCDDARAPRRTRQRFSDALIDLAQDEGVVTHRSHWVAYAHIEGWSAAASKPSLKLRDGSVVPVSRTYRDALDRMKLRITH